MLAGTEEAFRRKLREVTRLVTAHIEMEEGQLFRKADELFTTAQLAALGQRVTEEKQKLFRSWNSRLGRPLHRAKSVVDAVTPLAVKRRMVARRAHHADAFVRPPAGA